MSSRADVVPGSRPAGDLGQDSGVGPALYPDEPVLPHDYVELAARPTGVARARLHARNLLWEWGLDWLAPDAELLVAELITSAIRAKTVREEAAVRLRLSSDGSQVLIEVWDADRWSPPAALFLVSALSARWGWYPTREPRGKVVWCQLEASGYEPTVSGSLPVAPSL
jgi:hypothetical protein